MIEKTHSLKQHRINAGYIQQDVATLLNIAPSNLARYEQGNRRLSPVIIIGYHILFGATIQKLFTPLYQQLTNSILKRSQKLISQITDQSPKSKFRIGYLTEIVNRLSTQHTQDYDKC